MTDILTADALRLATEDLLRVRQVGADFEVELPVMYPDGQFVMLVVSRVGDVYRVHDAGGGAMYYESVGGRITRQLGQNFVSVADHYRCKYSNGRVWRESDADHLPMTIAIVANASRSVGDLAKMIRRRADRPFRATVAARLHNAYGERIRENEEVKGKSGKSYHLAALLLDAEQQNPLAFIEASASQSTVLSHVGQFVDLKYGNPNVFNVSVYDDNERWKAEDLRLLRQVSIIVPFSRTEMRMKRLVGNGA